MTEVMLKGARVVDCGHDETEACGRLRWRVLLTPGVDHMLSINIKLFASIHRPLFVRNLWQGCVVSTSL